MVIFKLITEGCGRKKASIGRFREKTISQKVILMTLHKDEKSMLVAQKKSSAVHVVREDSGGKVGEVGSSRV